MAAHLSDEMDCEAKMLFAGPKEVKPFWHRLD